MRFLKRLAGFLGLARDEGHEVRDDEDAEVNGDANSHQSDGAGSHAAPNRVHMRETGLPRKGFSVPVQVAVDRSQPGPLLALSHSGDGGLQGLKWYAKRLKVDEDGDVADEFFDEVTHVTMTSTSLENEREPFPRFQLKYRTTPAKVKKQAISQDGRFQQCVEHQGRLQWV